MRFKSFKFDFQNANKNSWFPFKKFRYSLKKWPFFFIIILIFVRIPRVIFYIIADICWFVSTSNVWKLFHQTCQTLLKFLCEIMNKMESEKIRKIVKRVTDIFLDFRHWCHAWLYIFMNLRPYQITLWWWKTMIGYHHLFHY